MLIGAQKCFVITATVVDTEDLNSLIGHGEGDDGSASKADGT